MTEKAPRRDLDLYMPSRYSRHKSVVTPRVILLDDSDRVAFVTHNGWHGLPGGHMTESEAETMQTINLLSIRGAFPTIRREIREETGRDVGPYLDRAACIGLCEIEILNLTHKLPITVEMLSPIFVCRVPNHTYPDLVVLSPVRKLPKPLYPDAALALFHLRRNRAIYRNHGPIFPSWLNRERKVIFVQDGGDGFVRYFDTRRQAHDS